MSNKQSANLGIASIIVSAVTSVGVALFLLLHQPTPSGVQPTVQYVPAPTSWPGNLSSQAPAPIVVPAPK